MFVSTGSRPFRSHHFAASLRLIGQTKTHPLARRLAAGLAVRPAPHTMLRIVFVAVDAKTKTFSDSLARRIRGSDSMLMHLVTFAP
ncbi:MAG: hypothetical protein BWY93_00507 [Euryarchaeota archaeon ADurb.BinA087]|nr:MAG: hypothetical protein BWY93_00507 [Euryarchaeota archaeon ADurb.BinA087]